MQCKRKLILGGRSRQGNDDQDGSGDDCSHGKPLNYGRTRAWIYQQLPKLTHLRHVSCANISLYGRSSGRPVTGSTVLCSSPGNSITTTSSVGFTRASNR